MKTLSERYNAKPIERTNIIIKDEGGDVAVAFYVRSLLDPKRRDRMRKWVHDNPKRINLLEIYAIFELWTDERGLREWSDMPSFDHFLVHFIENFPQWIQEECQREIVKHYKNEFFLLGKTEAEIKEFNNGVQS